MSKQAEVKLVLRQGVGGEVLVDGVDLAGVVGTIELESVPGKELHLVMHLVPHEVLVETTADIEFRCFACGKPMEKPEAP